MPTLADKINKNKSILKTGGGLFETTGESIMSRVQKAGMAPGAGASPMAAAGLGVSPDQAKMAGSSAQMGAVIRESVAPRTGERQPSERMFETEEEKLAKQKAEKLSNLELLGSRIGGIVNDVIDKAEATDVEALPLQLNTKKLKDTYPDITDEQITALENILSKGGMEAGNLSAEDLNTAAGLLGITGETRDTIIAKINEYINPTTDTVVDNITSTLGPTVSLSDFSEEDWQAFGLTGPADLVGLLGITEAEASQLTVGELQEKIDALLQADYDRVDELTRVANDPFYPESLRKAAQAELRGLSSVGVAATEADFEKLNEAVQSADEITVAGKTYTVDELLSDEQLTTLISSYLEDPESDFAKGIAKDLPQLVAFIENNKKALEDAMKYLDESIKEKIAVSKKNDELNKYSPKEGVDVDLTDVNKAIYGDEFEAGVFGDKQMSEGEFTIGEGEDAVTYYHQANLRSGESKFTQDEKTLYAQSLTSIQKMINEAPENEKKYYQDVLDSLTQFSSDAIKDILATNKISLKTYIDNKVTQAKNAVDLQKAIALGKNYDASLNTLLGGDKALSDVAQFIKEVRIYKNAKFGTITPEMQRFINLFDADQNGVIDAKASLQALQKFNSEAAVNTLVNFKSMFATNKVTLTSERMGLMWKSVQDGVLTSEEATAILNTNDVAQMEKLVAIVNSKPDAYLQSKGDLKNVIETYATNQFNAKQNEIFGTSDINAINKKLNLEFNPEVHRDIDWDRGAIEIRLNNLRDYLAKVKEAQANANFLSKSKYDSLIANIENRIAWAEKERGGTGGGPKYDSSMPRSQV